MDMTVKQMLGQKLIFGFHGTELSEEFIQLIREYKIGNVILFLRNVESAGQLRKLCAQVQELIQAETGYPAFIVIDQEGGMVSRLPTDAVNVPGAMAISATENTENARIAAEITIRQLRGLGVNFNMAPVLDVNLNPANPVIGVRSTGDDPERVARFGEAAVRAYENTGVYCCGSRVSHQLSCYIASVPSVQRCQAPVRISGRTAQGTSGIGKEDGRRDTSSSAPPGRTFQSNQYIGLQLS